MVSINPELLYAGYRELKSAYGLLCSFSSNILEIKQRLSNISGMDGAIELLHHTNKEVCDYIEQCRWLCQSLDTVCQLYISCENRILDYGENAIIHYSHPSTAFVDLSVTAAILREFSFIEERND